MATDLKKLAEKFIGDHKDTWNTSAADAWAHENNLSPLEKEQFLEEIGKLRYKYSVWRRTKTKCALCDAEDVCENACAPPHVCECCKRKAISILQDELVYPSDELRKLLALYLEAGLKKGFDSYSDYTNDENISEFFKASNLKSEDGNAVFEAIKNFFGHLRNKSAIMPGALLEFFNQFDVVWLAKRCALLGEQPDKKSIFRKYADVLGEWLRGKARICHVLETNTTFFYNPTTGIFENPAEGVLITLLNQAAPECNSTTREEIIKALKAENAIWRRMPCPSTYLIPLKNGVLDVRTLTLLPYSPEFGFTFKHPVSYDPAAKCQKIEQFLNEICADSDGNIDAKMKRGLKQLVAYCLHRGYPIQKMFFLIGAGANGKGVFCAVLQALLGKENVSNATLSKLCYDRFAASELEGCVANIANEMTVSELKNADLVKSLTSGTDRVRIERKFSPAYSISSHAKLITASNKPPKSPDASDGFYRRLNLFFFQRQFYGPDAKNGLELELTAGNELEGLLNDAIVELCLWLDSEGNFKPSAGFCNDLPVQELREIYERASDTLAAFEYDCCEITGNSSDEVSKETLFNGYRSYCAEKKLPALGELQFKREFADRNAGKLQSAQPRKGGSRERVYLGLKLERMEQVKTYSISDYNLLPSTRVSKNIPVPSVPNNQNTLVSDKQTENIPVPSVPAMVRFLKDVDAWVGSDGLTYGPFSAGALAELPVTEASWAIKSWLAEPAPNTESKPDEVVTDA